MQQQNLHAVAQLGICADDLSIYVHTPIAHREPGRQRYWAELTEDIISFVSPTRTTQHVGSLA
jgi:hypothetical protein